MSEKRTGRYIITAFVKLFNYEASEQFDIQEKVFPVNGKQLGIAFQLGTLLPFVPALSCNQGEILDLRLRKE